MTGQSPEQKRRAFSGPRTTPRLDAGRVDDYLYAVKRHWVRILIASLLIDALLGYWWWLQWRERNHDAVILAAASRYGVDPALVKAVVWRESRFNARARGASGEIGLMQVNHLAAEEWAQAERIQSFQSQQLFDPARNTLAGTWYLAKLLRRYAHTDDPLPYVLADYNAGRSNVLRWNKGLAATNSAAFVRKIDFPSTRQYVRSIVQRYAHYRPIFPPRSSRAEFSARLFFGPNQWRAGDDEGDSQSRRKSESKKTLDRAGGSSFMGRNQSARL